MDTNKLKWINVCMCVQCYIVLFNATASRTSPGSTIQVCTSTCWVLTRVNNINKWNISDSSFKKRGKHIQTSAYKQTLKNHKKKRKTGEWKKEGGKKAERERNDKERQRRREEKMRKFNIIFRCVSGNE